MLCILYVNAVGTLLCVTGILLERAIPATFARRWLWCVMIPVSVALPGYYRWHHTVSVGEVQTAVQPSLTHALGMGPLTVLDPGWWSQIQSYDTAINRLWLSA